MQVSCIFAEASTSTSLQPAACSLTGATARSYSIASGDTVVLHGKDWDVICAASLTSATTDSYVADKHIVASCGSLAQSANTVHPPLVSASPTVLLPRIVPSAGVDKGALCAFVPADVTLHSFTLERVGVPAPATRIFVEAYPSAEVVASVCCFLRAEPLSFANSHASESKTLPSTTWLSRYLRHRAVRASCILVTPGDVSCCGRPRVLQVVRTVPASGFVYITAATSVVFVRPNSAAASVSPMPSPPPTTATTPAPASTPARPVPAAYAFASPVPSQSFSFASPAPSQSFSFASPSPKPSPAPVASATPSQSPSTAREPASPAPKPHTFSSAAAGGYSFASPAPSASFSFASPGAGVAAAPFSFSSPAPAPVSFSFNSVNTSPTLAAASPASPTAVPTSPASPVAIRRTESVSSQQLSPASPVRSTSFLDDLAAKPDGYDSSPAVAALDDMLSIPFRYQRLQQNLNISLPRGLLLFGPPGVGKTWAVRTVAKRWGLRMIVINGGSLFRSGVVGDAEAQLRDAFRDAELHFKAEKKKASESGAPVGPTLIFIDEIDACCPNRSDASTGAASRVVTQLLTLMDGSTRADRAGVLVVGATNSVHSIDPALRRPGRFDKEIEVPVPQPGAREAILRVCTRKMPLDRSVDLLDVAERCVGYVGADLEAVCREAALLALKEFIASQPESEGVPHADALVLPRHFTAAMAKVPVSSRRGLTTFNQPSADKRAAPPREPDSGNTACGHPGEGAAQRAEGSACAGEREAGSVWDGVGGLSGVKQRLQQAVEWPLRFPRTFARLGLTPPRGILLYGPPGCAKTTLVRAVAAASSAAFISISGAASVYSSFVGESERAIREVFARARANLPCVVFIDEIDAIVTKRQMTAGGSGDSGGGSVESRILSTLLNEMDGISPVTAGGAGEVSHAQLVQQLKTSRLLVIAATNRPDMLDEALLRPGRFDQRLYVPPPDNAARADILRVHTTAMPLAADVQLAAVADATDLFTGADLQNLCREAALIAMRRASLGSGEGYNEHALLQVTAADFELARTHHVRPTLTAELLESYADPFADTD